MAGLALGDPEWMFDLGTNAEIGRLGQFLRQRFMAVFYILLMQSVTIFKSLEA